MHSLIDRGPSIGHLSLATMDNFLLSPFLARLLFWAAACACGIAHLAILRSVSKTTRHRPTELAWALIPAVVLACVLVMTWRALTVSV